MHILIIPSWYPRSNNEFSGIFFREQAEELSKRGHKISIITHQFITFSEIFQSKSLKNAFPLIKLTIENNLLVIRIQIPKIWNAPILNENIDQNFSKSKTGYTSKFLRIIKKLLNLMSKNLIFVILTGFYNFSFKKYVPLIGMPKVIIAQSYLFGGFVATKIKKRNKIPLIVIEHSSLFVRNMISENIFPIIRDAIKSTDKIFAVSQFLADQMSKKFPENIIEILPNPVNTDFFTPKEKAIEDIPFTFCIICYLAPHKGVDIAIKSFALKFKNKNVILKIGGDGKYRRHLQELVEELDIVDQVFFLGNLSRLEVKNLIQDSHVLISASYFETFGITIIESFSCGKPVISTKSGGPNYLINSNNGILVPVGDVNSLAEAMASIAINYSFYNHDKIRQSCLDLFSYEAYYLKLIETINNTLLIK